MCCGSSARLLAAALAVVTVAACASSTASPGASATSSASASPQPSPKLTTYTPADFATALDFTADQQAQIGLFCGSTFATQTTPITTCASPNRGALRIRIPADGTENDDTNPPRVTPRSLFDFSVGTDNLFRAEHTKVTLRFTGINITNKIALYNFLSTFSGTHFVTPRAFQIQAGVTF